jgi:hypothetical protein
MTDGVWVNYDHADELDPRLATDNELWWGEYELVKPTKISSVLEQVKHLLKLEVEDKYTWGGVYNESSGFAEWLLSKIEKLEQGNGEKK